MIDTYNSNLQAIHQDLPHREDRLQNLKGISLLKWSHFLEIFELCVETAPYEDERVLAQIAGRDFEKRINR